MTFNCPSCRASLNFQELDKTDDNHSFCPKCKQDISEFVHQLEDDMVNHPPHYNNSKSGVECIDITEWMNFCIGNAVKYLWRADEKGKAIEDLEKARWYVDREIQRRKKE